MYNIEPVEQPVNPNLITREQAAVSLSVSVQTVKHYIDSNRLTAYKLAHHYILVDKREVEVLKQARR